jgi:hypothetical protein
LAQCPTCVRNALKSGPWQGSAPRDRTTSKLDTTARYTQVATNIIREVISPLDRLTPLVPNKDEPPA